MFPLSAALLGFNCFVDEAWPVTDVVVTRDLPYGSNFSSVTGEVQTLLLDHLRTAVRSYFQALEPDTGSVGFLYFSANMSAVALVLRHATAFLAMTCLAAAAVVAVALQISRSTFIVVLVLLYLLDDDDAVLVAADDVSVLDGDAHIEPHRERTSDGRAALAG